MRLLKHTIFQTPNQTLMGNEKMQCLIDFMFIVPHHVLYPKPYFFSLFPSVTAKTCSGGLVLVVASNLGLTAHHQIGAKVIGAHLSF